MSKRATELIQELLAADADLRRHLIEAVFGEDLDIDKRRDRSQAARDELNAHISNLELALRYAREALARCVLSGVNDKTEVDTTQWNALVRRDIDDIDATLAEFATEPLKCGKCDGTGSIGGEILKTTCSRCGGRGIDKGASPRERAEAMGERSAFDAACREADRLRAELVAHEKTKLENEHAIAELKKKLKTMTAMWNGLRYTLAEEREKAKLANVCAQDAVDLVWWFDQGIDKLHKDHLNFRRLIESAKAWKSADDAPLEDEPEVKE